MRAKKHKNLKVKNGIQAMGQVVVRQAWWWGPGRWGSGGGWEGRQNNEETGRAGGMRRGHVQRKGAGRQARHATPIRAAAMPEYAGGRLWVQARGRTINTCVPLEAQCRQCLQQGQWSSRDGGRWW